jgi:hypothetical protein
MNDRSSVSHDYSSETAEWLRWRDSRLGARSPIASESVTKLAQSLLFALEHPGLERALR